MKSDDIRITVLFDNESCGTDLDFLWGFSCFIETPNRKILFDTGSNGRVLLKNMRKKGIDISSIDNIFISHSHWDHIGGLDSILELNPSVHIFLTSHISKNFIRDIENLCDEVSLLNDTPLEIISDIYSMGMIGKDGEVSMVIDTDEGLIIIVGCAHGGVENIAEISKQFLKKRILLLLGGFHLHNRDDEEILNIIYTLKELDTKFVAPSHCSGDRAKELFYKEFKNGYIDSGLGISLGFKKSNIFI